MTYVVLDDDLDWEFAFDSHLGHPNRNDWKYRRIVAASNEAGVLSNESLGGVVRPASLPQQRDLKAGFSRYSNN
jgi:hypothetical protein